MFINEKVKKVLNALKEEYDNNYKPVEGAERVHNVDYGDKKIKICKRTNNGTEYCIVMISSKDNLCMFIDFNENLEIVYINYYESKGWYHKQTLLDKQYNWTEVKSICHYDIRIPESSGDLFEAIRRIESIDVENRNCIRLPGNLTNFLSEVKEKYHRFLPLDEEGKVDDEAGKVRVYGIEISYDGNLYMVSNVDGFNELMSTFQFNESLEVVYAWQAEIDLLSRTHVGKELCYYIRRPDCSHGSEEDAIKVIEYFSNGFYVEKRMLENRLRSMGISEEDIKKKL